MAPSAALEDRMTVEEQMVLAGGQKCGGVVRVLRISPRLAPIEHLVERGLVEALPDHKDGDLVLVFRLTPKGHEAASRLLKAA
jgi:hypothetical protein